jgi:hypothetical protein
MRVVERIIHHADKLTQPRPKGSRKKRSVRLAEGQADMSVRITGNWFSRFIWRISLEST